MKNYATTIWAHIVLLICVLMFGIQLPSQAQKAVALNWTGQVETGIPFEGFYENDFSIAFRFMAQYPNAYYGPIVSNDESSIFSFGIGDYIEESWGQKLYLQVKGELAVYKTEIKAGAWYAVIISSRKVESQGVIRYEVYLNGKQLFPEEPILEPISNRVIPAKNIRLGRLPDKQYQIKKIGQFYGLISDFVVFNTRLNVAEISTLNKLMTQYTSAETLKAYEKNTNFLKSNPLNPTNRKIYSLLNFDKSQFKLNGAAKVINVSKRKVSAQDSKKFILPSAHKVMHLPFPPNEEWYVGQGYDDSSISHMGYASFCFDFGVHGYPSKGIHPKGSAGAPMYASASGRVANVIESSDGKEVANEILIEQGPLEFASYIHIQKDGVLLNKNDRALSGQKIAYTGHTGLDDENDHIHMGLKDRISKNKEVFVTFPFAFSNYEVKQEDNSWKFVKLGIPKKGQVLRNRVYPNKPYKVTAILEKTNSAEYRVDGWKFKDLKAKYNEIWAKGWRIKSINTHPGKTEMLYTVAWEKSKTSETQVYGQSYDNFKRNYDKLWKDGWRIHLLDIHAFKGKPYYTAIFRKLKGAEKQFYALSEKDAILKQHEYHRTGWNTKLIQPYVVGRQTYYAIIFVNNKDAQETLLINKPFKEFVDIYKRLYKEGWRLKDVSTHFLSGKSYHSGVFTKSNKGQYFYFNHSYPNFRHYYEHKYKDGWRIKSLDIN